VTYRGGERKWEVHGRRGGGLRSADEKERGRLWRFEGGEGTGGFCPERAVLATALRGEEKKEKKRAIQHPPI